MKSMHYPYHELVPIVLGPYVLRVKELQEAGIIGERYRPMETADEKDVRGQHVVGMLTMHLANLAEVVTEAGPGGKWVSYRVYRDDQVGR